jgi:hypothetical protein
MLLPHRLVWQRTHGQGIAAWHTNPEIIRMSLATDSTEGGTPQATGVSPTELTSSEDRDWFAGTPRHTHVPARVMALE